jgi:hypothetical protein
MKYSLTFHVSSDLPTHCDFPTTRELELFIDDSLGPAFRIRATKTEPELVIIPSPEDGDFSLIIRTSTGGVVARVMDTWDMADEITSHRNLEDLKKELFEDIILESIRIEV